ncbi:EpsG family protein [Thalassotalea euphylliae]|uniref:EpsG family protein n=1 Tax=Thalassotalea euphylliae TaxID=1655234 RepID=UPI00363CBE56
MLPYFIATFTALIPFFIAYRFKFNSVALAACMMLSSLPLILICGFKFKKVGTDTGSYIYFFNNLQTFEDAMEMASHHGEAGYWLMNALGHQFTDNYFILFTFTAVIVTCCYMYSLKVFNLKTLSLFTLLFIGPYFFQLNGNRQAITIALFSISVIFIIKEQPIRFLATVLIGFMFHKSMILCLPLYFVFKGEIKPRKIALILFGFLLFIIFFQMFISVASSIDSRYSTYGDQKAEGGGIVVSLFNIILFVWFLLARIVNKHILATRTYDVLLSLYLLGALISLMSIILRVDPSGFLRLSLYFVQLSTFLVPLSIGSFRDIQMRWMITLAAVLLMMAYFYLTMSTFSHLTPYRFNPALGI